MAAEIDSWEGPLDFSSLLFGSWVSFLFLWQSWSVIEFKYGMQSEFTRRVASLDLVVCHLGASTFFLPMKYLHNAPSSTFNGVIVISLFLYVIAFYLGMALLKLSQSVFYQLITVLMMLVYLVLFYIAVQLSELITVDLGVHHSWWLLFNFFAMAAIVLVERYRVNHFDPLDYNYTAAQRAKMRQNKYNSSAAQARGEGRGEAPKSSSSSSSSSSSMQLATRVGERVGSGRKSNIAGGGGKKTGKFF